MKPCADFLHFPMFEDINHQVTIISLLSIRKFPDYFLLFPAAMEATATQWAHGQITLRQLPQEKG